MTAPRSRPKEEPLPGKAEQIGVIVSRYHERITTALLAGAKQCCQERSVPDDQIDVVWVPGAFELGVVAGALLENARYKCLVALGVVVRGETPHFDFVAGETSRVLAMLAAERGVPIGFGLLTVDTLEQAVARAGGAAGNKGYEAADAAIRTADLLRQLRHARAPHSE